MKIAITGTMGAGKSTVSQLLRQFGYPVIDSDALAKSYYDPTSRIHDRLVELLKDHDVFNDQGILDKTKYTNLFFNDPTIKIQVSELIYATMRQDFNHMASLYDPFIAEVPLLFEAKMDDLFDHILVVTADPCKVMDRLEKYRGVDRQQYKKRMAYQYDDDYKLHHASSVIYNDSTMEDLKRQVKAWIKHVIDHD